MQERSAMPRSGGCITAPPPEASTGSILARLHPVVDWRGAVTASALLIGWALCNPYFEVDHSSLIYAGRMLAELDPTGVGSDAMYRLDGQSAFTLFTMLDRQLVLWMGLASANLAISVASVLGAFAGAAAFVRSVSHGRTRLLAIIYVATLPAFYGGYKLFSYAENAATPRPFAEALVMTGAACLVSGRLGWAAAAMLAAGLLHPIIALPGVLLLAIWLVVADKRWWLLVAVTGAIGLAGVALHLPLFDRLTEVIDPAWKAVLVGRDPHLFPTLWPEGWKGRAAARIATLILAASLTGGPVRKVFLLILAVGLIGFGVAYLLNDRWPIVLLVQAQTWRTTWLAFAVAPVAGAICTLRLWPSGGTRRVSLVLLALSWIFADYDQVALMLALASLAFYFCVEPADFLTSKRWNVLFVAVAAAFAITGLVLTGSQIALATAAAPAGYGREAARVLALDWDYTPLAVLGACLLERKRGLSTAMIAAIAVSGLVLLGATWDRRSDQTRTFDAGAGMPDLLLMVDTKPGEVLWLGGVQEAWRWLGRPNWLSPIQGAGTVFSRPLAILYRDRALRMAAAGLDDGSLLHPYDVVEGPGVGLDEHRLATFCAAPDAPAWIVVPWEGSVHLPAALKPTRWTVPTPRLEPEPSKEGAAALRWRLTSQVEMIACAGGASVPGVQSPPS